MAARLPLQLARVAALAAAACVPALAAAQEWGFRAGATARMDYTDNYQLRAFDAFSAVTTTVSPFVTGYRRTETSQLNLLAGVGYNYIVADQGGNDDYWSGRLSLSGSAVHERHSYGFSVGVVRDQTLRTETRDTGIVFGAGSTRTGATAGVNYGYVLTERWNAGVFGSVFTNAYDQVQGGSAIRDNDGWSVGGNLGYALTERTQLTLAASYSRFSSDITDSDSISTTLAVSHQYSQQLSLSAYGGYFWSNIESTQNFFVCPTTPIFCQLGFVAPVQVAFGTERDSSGTLFGGSASYRYSERTTFGASASQNLQPSGIGTITKVTGINASVSHAFTERMRGQLGANWRRSTVPGTDNSATGLRSTYYSFGGSLSYDLAREWLVTAGVRRDHSDQRGLTADANVLFVSIAYNWPGQSIGDWGGFFPGGFDVGGAFPAATPGAGTPPQAVPGQPLPAPAPVPRAAPEDSNQ